MSVETVIAYARERHLIHLRRQAGVPRSQWTQDPILQQYRFCNVYRELDRTTIWLRENVRERLASSPDLLLATVIFRWFNRITSGEAIFQQLRTNFSDSGAPGETAWEELIRTRSLDGVRDSLVCWCGSGPYVTGSYIIKTPDGMSKLDGVLWCLEKFMTECREMPGVSGTLYWQQVATVERDACVTLEMMWRWLCRFPYLGEFMAAQIVADLKYTHILANATDWHTFAASGPGSRRGLNVARGRDPDARWRERDWHESLLELREQITPMFVEEGWEIPHAQDVQNICCEIFKYSRGWSRQVFR